MIAEPNQTFSIPQDRVSHPRPGLLVVIPAKDEVRTVGVVVSRVPRDIAGVDNVEVLVVDDGSEDGTADVAAGAGATVLKHRQCLGVGAAFHTALAYFFETDADCVVTIDGDGQFAPESIPALLGPVLEGAADFVTASRFMDPRLTPRMPRIKLWGNRIMSRLISRLVGQRFHDVSCGFRCYSRQAALRLHLMGQFTYTQEVFLNLAFKHLRIVEIPLVIQGMRQFGRSRVADNLWSYGWRAIKIIVRCYRDFFPMRLFGSLALALTAAASGLACFLLVHFGRSGSFFPHKWAGFTAIVLGALAVVALHLGTVGDMLNRHRLYLEELLYRQRAERVESSARPGALDPRSH